MQISLQLRQGVALFATHNLGDVAVTYDGKSFKVIHQGATYEVDRNDLDTTLRGIDLKALQKALTVGYLTLSQKGDDYALTYKCRGPGGGPLLAQAGYWTTKTLCYGTAVAGAGAAVMIETAALAAMTACLALPTP